MKRTSMKDKHLKLRLELVRTTVRELTQTQLEHVNGGNKDRPPPDSDFTCTCPIKG
jgi:hypothetical protein